MYSINMHLLMPSSGKTRKDNDLRSETKMDNVELHRFPPSEGVFSDAVSSVRICSARRNPRLGSSIHARLLKSGLANDVFVCNSLLDMYAKSEHIGQAAKVFDQISERTVESWTAIMSGYCQNGRVDEVFSLFERMLEALPPNEYTMAVLLQACARKGDQKLTQVVHCFVIKYEYETDNFLQNSLIDAYAKSGMLGTAEQVLDRLSCRDVVSWTSAISGHASNGTMKSALLLFFRMQGEGILPNEVTILSILRACSSIKQWRIFQWVHGLVMKTEWCRNSLVMNSLVEMYAVNGYFKEAIELFSHFCFSGEGEYLSPETMASLIQGCGHSGYFSLGKDLHAYLVKHRFFPCTAIENSLMDMYGESGQIDFVSQLFRQMNFKDIVSWNTLMTCLVKNKQFSEVLKLLGKIHAAGAEENVFPDFITMLTSIQACSSLASLQLGQVIHGYATRTGFISDIFVQNSLIDMYGKSGRSDFAVQVFKEMPLRDLGAWNSLIAAYGFNGDAISALKILAKLKKSDTHQPNAITFTSVLSACAHGGLINEAFDIFSRMKKDHGVDPRMEHFACMVDLIGRTGGLEEALALIDKMPMRPGPDVWGALLGACVLFSNVEIAERAASELSALQPNCNTWRVALSNVYAGVGRWKDAAKARAEAHGFKELLKGGGWSSVEVKGHLHTFMAADTSHPKSKMIYEVVNGMQEQIKCIAITDPRIAS
ncbi:hypothetical protein NMG60_11027049 [Bertholletia excelsa]